VLMHDEWRALNQYVPGDPTSCILAVNPRQVELAEWAALLPSILGGAASAALETRDDRCRAIANLPDCHLQQTWQFRREERS